MALEERGKLVFLLEKPNLSGGHSSQGAMVAPPGGEALTRLDRVPGSEVAPFPRAGRQGRRHRMGPPLSIPSGIAITTLGLAALATVAVPYSWRSLGLGLGLPLLFVGIGILGKYGRYARALQKFVGQEVRIKILNMALAGSIGSKFEIEAIALMGAGLWIYVRSAPGGTPKKLKIAQPTALAMGATYAEISFAGYAQWDGRKLGNPIGAGCPGKVILYSA